MSPQQKWILILLVLCGLNRTILAAVDIWTPRWHLGPLAHTFTFGNSLKSVKVIADLSDSRKSEYEFKVGDWELGSEYGYFVRRDLLSAFQSTETKRAVHVINTLRKKHLCGWTYFSQPAKQVHLFNKGIEDSEYKHVTSVVCP